MTPTPKSRCSAALRCRTVSPDTTTDREAPQ